MNSGDPGVVMYGPNRRKCYRFDKHLVKIRRKMTRKERVTWGNLWIAYLKDMVKRSEEE